MKQVEGPSQNLHGQVLDAAEHCLARKDTSQLEEIELWRAITIAVHMIINPGSYINNATPKPTIIHAIGTGSMIDHDR